MINISPSLICMDLCNVLEDVKKIESLEIKMLHIDIIDGIFSPDMPLGIDMVAKLREKTNLIFDCHLMSVNNEPYFNLLSNCGVDRLCFHTEFEPRPNILIKKIKEKGIKAGVAISPETTIDSLKHIIPMCDFVLLMRIDPGYAHLGGQGVYDYVLDKIKEVKEKFPSVEIEVDGRVNFDDIKELSKIGVETFVCGTKSMFVKGSSVSENYDKIKKMLD